MKELTSLPVDLLDAALSSISPSRNANATASLQNTAFAIWSAISGISSSRREVRSMTANQPVVAQNRADAASDLIARADAPTINAPVFDEEDFLAARSKIPYRRAKTAERRQDTYAIWVQGLGEFIHQNPQNQNPAFRATTTGGLIGIDHWQERSQVSAAAGYAYTWLDQSQHSGSGIVQSYFASVYGAAYQGKAYIEYGLIGVYNQYENQRHVFFPGFNATARSSSRGGQLVPHIAVGYDFNFNWGFIEPFIEFDCAIAFQQGFSEHGAGTLNMTQKRILSEVVRAVVGLNSYQAYRIRKGSLIMRETVSYVNQQPLSHNISAELVGAPSFFSLSPTTKNQSFFSPGAEIFFRANNGAFLSGTYNGEFGSGYVSQTVLGEVGYFF